MASMCFLSASRKGPISSGFDGRETNKTQSIDRHGKQKAYKYYSMEGEEEKRKKRETNGLAKLSLCVLPWILFCALVDEE